MYPPVPIENSASPGHQYDPQHDRKMVSVPRMSDIASSAAAHGLTSLRPTALASGPTPERSTCPHGDGAGAVATRAVLRSGSIMSTLLCWTRKRPPAERVR